MKTVDSKRLTVGGKRKVGSKRRSLIKTTHKAPRWKRELDASWKGLKRQAWNVLAGVGLITVLVLIARALGGG